MMSVFRRAVEQRRDFVEHVGREGVVVVEQGDELALGQGEGCVGVAGDAEILRQTRDADAFVLFGVPVENGGDARVAEAPSARQSCQCE